MSLHANLTAAADLHRPGVQSNSDPGAIGAYKIWIDTGVDGSTSSPVIKVRNGTDAGWVTVGVTGGTERSIGACFDGSGYALTLIGTTKVTVSAPVAGTITAARITTRGGTGSCTIGVKKCTYANFPGSLADITAGGDVTLSSAHKAENTTLSGWTTTFAAGDVFEFELKSASTITQATVLLIYTPS